jgi:hypothetical protein
VSNRDITFQLVTLPHSTNIEIARFAVTKKFDVSLFHFDDPIEAWLINVNEFSEDDNE